MKMKTTIATVAIALVALVSTASARGMTDADKTLVKKAMKYIGAMATLIEKATEKPAALGELERYIDKNRKAIGSLSSKLDQVEKDLDPEAKAEFQKYVQARPEMKKFMGAVMDFFAKHGKDKAVMERMQKALEKLQSTAESEDDAKKDAPRKK